MSKYSVRWEYIRDNMPEALTFGQIEDIAGVPIDHSFLTYKKELLQYGWEVEKISRKQETVRFRSLRSNAK